MKIKLRIVLFIFTIIIALGVKFCATAVIECYKCKELHATDCHSPVTNVSLLDKESCGVEPADDQENATGDAAVPTETPTERLVEREGEAAKKEYKFCMVVVGKDNLTDAKITYRGCSTEGCNGLTMTIMKEPECKDCDKDLCNSTVKINPIEGILTSLLIPISCLILEWDKFRI